MDPEAPSGVTRRGKRRWMRRLLVTFLFLPLIAFGLSNLALSSQWGRDRIAAQIKARTTLDTSIEGATWSPWNGVTLRKVRLDQPEALRAAIQKPLADISALNVQPDWQVVLRGKIGIRRIVLEKPEVVLPLEILAHFATPPQLPVIAAAVENPGPTSPEIAVVPGQSSGPYSPPPTTPPGPPVEIAAEPVAEPTLPAPPLLPGSPDTEKRATDFIDLKDASISFVFSGSPTPIAEISGVNGSVPLGGKSAESFLSISSIRALGNETAENLRLPISWKSPLLSLPESELPISNLKMKTTGQFGMVSGMPFVFQAVAPDQKIDPLELPGGSRFSPAEVGAGFRIQGSLIAPASWQADAAASAGKSEFLSDGQITKFDSGRLLVVLRNGTLSCIDARLTGDDVSFLGNATILSSGRTAAVLRVVAPPETTTSIARKLFPGVTAPPAFNSMSSPQRVALDIEASGTLGDLDIRLGKNGPLVGQETPPASATPK